MPDPQSTMTAILSAIGGGALSAVFGYGVAREKIARLEKDVEALRGEIDRDRDKFVTFQHFETVLDPVKRMLDVVQRDIKEILTRISK